MLFRSDINGNNIIAGTASEGLYYSDNNGQNWTLAADIPDFAYVSSIVRNGNDVFAVGSCQKVFLSSDNGHNWVERDNGITSGCLTSLAVSGTKLLAGTYNYGGPFLSTDYGLNWTRITHGLGMYTINAVAFCGNDLYVGYDQYGMFRSSDNGATWNAVNNGLTSLDIRSIAVIGINIFAGTFDGVFLSTNNGASWVAVNTGLPLTNGIGKLAVSGTDIFVGANGAIYKSNNNGTSWSMLGNGSFVNGYIVAASNNKIVAGDMGIYLSTDNGANWHETGLPVSYVRSLLSSHTDVFAISEDEGMSVLTDNCQIWKTLGYGLGLNTYVLAIDDSTLYAGNDSCVFRSTDYGLNWLKMNNGLDGKTITGIGASGSMVIAGTEYYGIFVSNNNGQSWTSSIDSISIYANVICFAFKGNTIFAGTNCMGIYTSSDNGQHWTPSINGLPAVTAVFSIKVQGSYMYAATLTDGVYSSIDNGQTWIAASNGIPTGTNIFSLSANEFYVCIGTDAGVYVSDNHGLTWTAASVGLPVDAYIYAVEINGGYLYAGTNGYGVWKRPLSELANIQDVLCIPFSIFPNPATKNITINIPQKATSDSYRIEITSIEGQIIKTLSNNNTETTIDVSDLSPGVYIIKAQSNKGVIIRKFIKQ